MKSKPVILRQPPLTGYGLPNLSPSCVKLELYLKAANIEYIVKPADPRKAPKRMVPWVHVDGCELGDSQLIIEYLKQRFGDPLDAHLSNTDKVTGHLVRRTLEEGTYWCFLCQRWVEDDGFAALKPFFMKMLPGGPLKGLLLAFIRRQTRQRAISQGAGRHSRAEVESMAAQDVAAVVATLGDKPFLLGDRFTSYDCCVYAFLSAVAFFPGTNASKTFLLSQPPAMDYLRRITESYFPSLLRAQFPVIGSSPTVF